MGAVPLDPLAGAVGRTGIDDDVLPVAALRGDAVDAGLKELRLIKGYRNDGNLHAAALQTLLLRRTTTFATAATTISPAQCGKLTRMTGGGLNGMSHKTRSDAKAKTARCNVIGLGSDILTGPLSGLRLHSGYPLFTRPGQIQRFDEADGGLVYGQREEPCNRDRCDDVADDRDKP